MNLYIFLPLVLLVLASCSPVPSGSKGLKKNGSGGKDVRKVRKLIAKVDKLLYHLKCPDVIDYSINDDRRRKATALKNLSKLEPGWMREAVILGYCPSTINMKGELICSCNQTCSETVLGARCYQLIQNKHRIGCVCAIRPAIPVDNYNTYIVE